MVPVLDILQLETSTNTHSASVFDKQCIWIDERVHTKIKYYLTHAGISGKVDFHNWNGVKIAFLVV